MSAKVGVLGSGVVGQVLADGFLKHGYEVMRASRDPQKLSEWKQGAGDSASVGTFGAAASWADILVLAVKGSAAVAAIELCDVDALAFKTVIDATNPIGEEPPANGVVSFFTGPNESLMERLQAAAPEARFVKAFSCVGNALMIDPEIPGGPPTMFICGNDSGAKGKVREILTQFGWETEDMGAVEAARAIEPLCMLWCIPGFRENRWMHAFKLLNA
jgi:predicted dinucleotide-binding enzyme